MLSIYQILLVVLASLAYLQFRRKYRLSNLPPGPGFFLFFGHLPLLGLHPPRKLLEWKEKYGPIFSIRFGSFPAVVLNDSTTMRAALAMPSLSGRASIRFTDELGKGRSGVSMSDGNEAMLTLAFLKKTLREYAFAKERSESGMLDLIPGLLAKIQAHVRDGSPLNVKHFFGFSVVSYMWGVAFGSDPLEDKERVEKFAETLADLVQLPIPVMLGMLVPKLAQIFPGVFGHEKQRNKIEEGFQGFIFDLVEEHRRTRIPGHPRDLVDTLLDFYNGSNKWHVPVTTMELVGASVETVSSSLEWSIFYLVKHPEVQRKIFEEIERQVGMEARPSLNHRSSMPYTEAFLLELLRKSSVLPLSVFHSALEDTEFRGYVIPKGTLILPNLYAANHDPQLWAEPNSFRPERFLDESGGLMRRDEVVAFGTGRRKCIGEPFARNQLFLFLVSILQRFEFRGDELKRGVENGAFGFTFAPQPFSVIVRLRKESPGDSGENNLFAQCAT